MLAFLAGSVGSFIAPADAGEKWNRTKRRMNRTYNSRGGRRARKIGKGVFKGLVEVGGALTGITTVIPRIPVLDPVLEKLAPPGSRYPQDG
jgi:hypothetical protein